MLKVLALAISVWIVFAKCSSSDAVQPPKPAASPFINSQNSQPAGSGTTGPTNTPNAISPSSGCSSSVTSSTTTTTLAGNTSSNINLALVDSVSYDSHIRALISSKCLSCHTNTTDKPDLSTWNGVQAASTRIISTSGSDRVVSTGHSNRFSLTSDEKTQFQQWAQGGYLQSSSPTPTSSSSPSPSSVDNCTNNSLSQSLSSPPKLSECNSQGLVYDYEVNKDVAPASQTCTTFKLGTWCDVEGIAREFGASGNAARTKVNELTGQGYRINQCGEDGSARFVYLIKEEVINNENQLKIYKLRPK